MGTMNVHLCSDYNRNIFYGIVQKIGLDICVVTETWFTWNTSSKIMESTFGSDFNWFGRERKISNNKRNSGGIGILFRKKYGKCILEKMYPDDEILWVKLIIGNEIYFICEADCIIFRKSVK